MNTEFWKKETSGKADRIINVLLSEKKPEGWDGSFTLEFHLRVISAMTKDHLSTGEILQVLTEMHKQGKNGSAEFRETYIEDQKMSCGEQCRWIVCMPWAVKPDPWAKISFQITVGGICFKVSGWDRYERRIKDSPLWPELCEESHRSDEVFSGLCLSAESVGRGEYEAWEAIAPAFYALRGIVELVFGFGQRKWSVAPQPQGYVPHPLWVAMIPEKRDPARILFHNDHRESVEERVTVSHVKRMQALARSFRKAPKEGSTDELLFDSLGIYAQAMDERIPSRALMAFWQLAEALTLAVSQNGRTDVVVKRSAAVCQRYWKLDYEEILETLQVFADHRNGIVHEGNSGYIEMDDCSFFKAVCDTLISWLLKDRKKLPTKAVLEQYYRHSRCSQQEIKNLLTALRYLSMYRM